MTLIGHLFRRIDHAQTEGLDCATIHVEPEERFECVRALRAAGHFDVEVNDKGLTVNW